MERDIIRDWNSKTGTEQYDMIAACVYKATQKEYGPEMLYQRGHCADEYISETWLRLAETMTPGNVAAINAQRQQAAKQPITLISMIYRAVRASMAAIARADHQADNHNGGELEPELEGNEDCAEAVVIAVDLQRFMAKRDARDNSIAELVEAGYTEREIGKAVGISSPAVHKRIARIRKELKSEIA